jgi:hypothetical protein
MYQLLRFVSLDAHVVVSVLCSNKNEKELEDVLMAIDSLVFRKQQF